MEADDIGELSRRLEDAKTSNETPWNPSRRGLENVKSARSMLARPHQHTPLIIHLARQHQHYIGAEKKVDYEKKM